MPAGDLITRDDQYQVDDLLFGSRTPLITNNWVGLDEKPDININDTQRQDAWGILPGIDLYKERVATHDLSIDGTDNANVLALRRQFLAKTGIFKTPKQLVFQHNNGLGKRFIWVVRARAHLPRNDVLAHGLAQGSCEWTAADPRIYSLVLQQDHIVIPNGVNSINGIVINGGEEASAPVLVIQGPCTNPRISNAADRNRVIRIDIVLAGADILTIDTKARQVTKNGVAVAPGTVRSDNQWWALQPGNNQITYSRADTGGPSDMNVQHRDVWVQ
jgi:hypothetical protein